MNAEAACLPDCWDSTLAPCSPCPPRFLRAKNLVALRRYKRRRHPCLHHPAKLRKVELSVMQSIFSSAARRTRLTEGALKPGAAPVR